MSRLRAVVVVGAGPAGAAAADALRGRGFDGTITMIGDEPYPPYARPALSKGVLAGRDPATSVLLPGGPDVDLRLGTRVTALDLAARRLRTAGGEPIPFDGLVVATGSRARRLDDGFDETVLRTLDDALRLRAELRAAGSLVVLGGGLLGMEVASVARDLGVAVTVVDLRPPLVAALGAWPAALLTRAARDRGVRVAVSPGGVRRLAADVVELADGSRLAADLVVTAIGDRPDVGWLAGSGLASRPRAGGLVVDSRCRAAAGVVGAGDVAVFPGLPGGARGRSPFWENARAQAQAAAHALLHGDDAPPYRPEPYHWTEAFGIALKVAGPLPVAGPPRVLRGSPETGSALLRWDGTGTAMAVNLRLPVARLRSVARSGDPAAPSIAASPTAAAPSPTGGTR